jgi:hypothetical protein
VEIAPIGPVKSFSRFVPKYHLDGIRRIPVSASLGLHFSGASFPHADPSDIPTIVAGVAKRVAGDPPPVNIPLFTRFTEFVERWLVNNLTPLDEDTTFDVETWLAQSNYSNSRQRALYKHYRKLYDAASPVFDARTRKVKCFIKDESYPSFKHPRGIYARVDDIKFLLGPCFKKIEHLVYAHPSFIKHVPVAERATYISELLRYTDKKLGSDYSSYEKHFTSITYAIEFLLYRFMLQRCRFGKWYYDLIVAVLAGMNFCIFKMLNAKIPAGRMSGEMNTSLGNGFVNLMLFLFINFLKGNTAAVAVVEGDDLIGGFSGEDIVAEDYAALGFTIKVQCYQHIADASFCGLIFDPDVLVSIPDPTKIILNVGWTASRYRHASDLKMKGLLRAKGYSMLYQYPGVPIVQNLAVAILRITGGVPIVIPSYWTHWQIKHGFSTNVASKTIDIRTRFLMERIFKYSLSEQFELERYFDSLSKVEPLFHPIVLDKCERDMLTYNQRFVHVLDTYDKLPMLHAVTRSTLWKFCQVELIQANHGDVKLFSNNIVSSSFGYPVPDNVYDGSCYF